MKSLLKFCIPVGWMSHIELLSDNYRIQIKILSD